MTIDPNEFDNYDELYDAIHKKRDYHTWSPSSTKEFLSCRLKYFFKYVKGWKIKEKSTNLALGTSFHAAVEMQNRRVALNKAVTKADSFEEYETQWNNEVLFLSEGEDYKDQKELDKARQIGLDLIEKHWNSHTRKAIEPAIYCPPYSSVFVPAVEMHLDVPIINMRTGKPHNTDHHITGFIDLVSSAKRVTKLFHTNDLMVIDYKTAGREWDQFTVDTTLQLLIYAYGIRYVLRNENWFPHLKKDKEDLVGIICLVKRKPKGATKFGLLKNYFIRIDDREIEYLERLLMKCIGELNDSGDNAENFLPNPTPDNCRFCRYKEPCLLMRRGARNSDILAWGEENGFLRKKD
jgi:hypothetical protein